MKQLSKKIEFAGYEHNPIPDLTKHEVASKAQTDAFRGQDFVGGALPHVMSEIKEVLENYLTDQIQKYQGTLHVLQTRADEKKSNIDRDNIDAQFRSKITKLSRLVVTKIKADLEHKEEVFHQANDGFLRFKRFHDRALMPMRANPTFMSVYGLLGFLFFVEATVNALFFVQIVGLMAAYVLSIAQAFINISTCFIVGKMVLGGAFFSKKLRQRLSYWAIFFVQFFMMIWLNLMLGLYRALSQMQGAQRTAYFDPEVLQQAIVPFAHLDLYSVDSALVVCVGFVLALISYLKGYYSDDPYPGYGARYREAIKARDAVSQEVQEIYVNVAEAKEELAAAIVEVKKELQPSIKARSQAINTIEKCFIDYDKLLQTITSAYKNQCDLYEVNYGQAAVGEPIKVSRYILTDRDRNSAATFEDAVEYHMTDVDRLSLIAQEREQFSEEYGMIQKQWSEKIAEFETFINGICRNHPAMAVGVTAP